MVIKISNVTESMLESEDVEQLVGPEIRFVIPDDQWDLFWDEDDSDSRQHSFDDSWRNKMSKPAKFKNTKQHLKETCNGNGQEENQ